MNQKLLSSQNRWTDFGILPAKIGSSDVPSSGHSLPELACFIIRD